MKLFNNSFMSNKINPDYALFLDIDKQYGGNVAEFNKGKNPYIC